MNPFEALGEAMQMVGLWVMNLACRVRGHRWVADETSFGDFTKLEGWYCSRCWKVEPYTYLHEDAKRSVERTVDKWLADESSTDEKG